ncbi:glycoside hydrolase family 31 protein [Streptomyces sp. ISL-10]|uniref:glycoside hydrolase family 31 protein n=1 Tax=Streptomyces sp. ISL-10 TaxID=2819172 RepID=UPI001BEC1F1A|nr:glycoside hydrolase family 31 protein [Streptomyces sp. ISL-10]MBT2367703.1 glycoside hydrolase family 31 protein [Streptomyces sp. ISL-10]
MDGRDLVRAVRNVGSVQGLRAARSAWRRSRADARGLSDRGTERARVPGPVVEAEPLPGGGIVRFARSELRVVVATGGAVFRGWDGAQPLPSYGLAGPPPEPDPRAGLEPDKDGGWRVVSERVTVEVSRHGAVEIRTPGGVVLRRDLPPRWWEPVAGGGPARWSQRCEVGADARMFGLGGRVPGPRLRGGVYRLWNGGTGRGAGPEGDAAHITMPVQMVVADAGTHLAFHDTSWDGRVTVREGEEGAGSGHDRPGTIELRMDGGPLRSWVLVGTPARVLSGFAQLTGAPALPPSWALGLQHAGGGSDDEQAVRELVAAYRERGLPLSAVHLGGNPVPSAGGRGRAAGPAVPGRRRSRETLPEDAAGPFGVDEARFPDLPALAKDLREEGVRLVRVVGSTVAARPGEQVYETGVRAGAFVRDARGREVRGVAASGDRVHPDFTDPRTRVWWGERYEELLEQGFSGMWHEGEAPWATSLFGAMALPRSARHVLEGRGGDHQEAHNVNGLAMARAAYEGLCRLRPEERPFLVSGSGWTGVQRYGGVWPGQEPEGWPALRATLARVLGLGVCGVPFSGAEAGGSGAPLSAELYLRRLQLGAYLPLLRTGAPIGRQGAEPWEFGPEVLAHARAALRERDRLRPYLIGLAHLARLTGAPCARPLWWGSPGDRVLRDCEDAFLLGDSLLVAPVLEPGADRRAVRLPRGRWYDTATGRAYEGPAQVLVEAPLARIPVLARAGTVLAVRADDGRVEIEAWAPAPGRKGGGLVVRDTGDGWALSEIERYATRLVDGRVVVERVTDEGRVPVEGPVRVRGLD